MSDPMPRKTRRRAWRRHHAQRVKQRSHALAPARGIDGPAPEFDRMSWRDLSGVWRQGVRTWKDVHAFRAAQEKRAEHPAACSCEMCGNPRRHYGEATLQEQRRARADRESLVECGIPDSLVD